MIRELQKIYSDQSQWFYSPFISHDKLQNRKKTSSLFSLSIVQSKQ